VGEALLSLRISIKLRFTNRQLHRVQTRDACGTLLRLYIVSRKIPVHKNMGALASKYCERKRGPGTSRQTPEDS